MGTSHMKHLVVFNSWGYLKSFGIFQPCYTASLGITDSAIFWIGSVHILLIYFTGSFSSRALDVGYYHPVLACSFFLKVLAGFMTSISTQYYYWQLFLA